MASRYTPKIGDIVDYDGKHKVIVETYHCPFFDDFTTYLLDEDKLEEFVSDKKEEICTKVIHTPKCIPFSVIGKHSNYS